VAGLDEHQNAEPVQLQQLLRRRRTGSARPNLAPLMMDRAMLPALQSHVSQATDAVAKGVDRAMRKHRL